VKRFSDKAHDKELERAFDSIKSGYALGGRKLISALFCRAGLDFYEGINALSSSRQASLKHRRGSSAPLFIIARRSGKVLFGEK